ncbi:WG repeat-containing protein [Anaerotignum sp.]
MKKLVCMAMATMMTVGAVPAYGAEWVQYGKEETVHTFTAKAGTTEFRKNGEKQSLDVPVYIKDGYVMLPLRTFMKAVDEDATMVWHNGANLAEVRLGTQDFTFDVNTNRIWREGELLPVSGKMEVRDGRVFVPLRNWGNILNKHGYVVKDGDIQWNAKTKTATIRAADVVLVDTVEKPTFTGEGAVAAYAVKLTEKYDDIQPVGEGYFIAKKYVNDKGDLRGQPDSPYNWQSDWFLLDETGKELLTYSNKEVASLKDQGEGLLRVNRWDGPDLVIDRAGKVQFETECSNLHRFSEGFAAFLEFQPNAARENEDGGYIDKTGKIVIPQKFFGTDDFSEGLAVASIQEPSTSRPQTLCGYIDKTGNWVIEPKYWNAFDFKDGIARVSLNGRYGYIDKEGNEIVKPRYYWAGDFHDGKAFVQERDGRVFLIDTTGKQLKQITDAQRVNSYADGILRQTVTASVAPGNVKSVDLYFDENEQISYREAQLRAGLSEGLAAMQEEETGKYGYVNEAGEWIITPAFDAAEPFEDGYAVVANETEDDVAWGIIEHPDK